METIKKYEIKYTSVEKYKKEATDWVVIDIDDSSLNPIKKLVSDLGTYEYGDGIGLPYTGIYKICNSNNDVFSTSLLYPDTFKYNSYEGFIKDVNYGARTNVYQFKLLKEDKYGDYDCSNNAVNIVEETFSITSTYVNNIKNDYTGYIQAGIGLGSIIVIVALIHLGLKLFKR